MDLSTGQPSTIPSATRPAESVVVRRLRDVYAIERLQEVLGAIVDDALDPSRSATPLWRDEGQLAVELRKVIRAVAVGVDQELCDAIATLLRSEAPTTKRRMTSAPSYGEHF